VPWHDKPLRDMRFAAHCFARALQAVPEHRAALNNLSFALKHLGQGLESQQLLEQVPTKAARRARARRRRASALVPVESRPAVEPLEFKPATTRGAVIARLTSGIWLNEPPTVLYDVSVFGAAAENPISRSGVFRVVENLALALLASGECHLRFCVLDPRQQQRTLAWLKEQLRLAHVAVSVPEPASYVLERTAALKARAEHRGYKTVPEKIALEYMRFLRRFSGPPKPSLPREDLSWAKALHLPFFVALPAVRAYRRLPLFQTVYDLIPLLFPSLFDNNVWTAFLRAQLANPAPNQWFFAISNCTKHDLCNSPGSRVAPERVFVTHLAASDSFHPCSDRACIDSTLSKYGIPPEPYFLSVCTLEPRKNLAHTIRCWGRLIREKALGEANLVLVGAKGWQYKQIYEQAGSCPELNGRVFFTGYVPDQDLSPLYSGALGFLYLSLYEGFGLPVLEAMQCGTPVIAANNSSLPEVAGQAAILLDAKDEDGLCDAMLRLYRDSELRQALQTKGLEQARQFGWERCAQETIQAYRVALAHAAAR
jgi:glycosyltransferase involved in cell wall biosynthesis